MKLIVGLGNPGKEYEKTRHNIGYMVLDSYLGNVNWKTEKLAYIYKIKHNSEDILFIKPTTYMNQSGEAVSYYVNYFKIDLNDVLIIQDDMDLNIGKIKLKYNSSSGGHNGIKSIINYLKTSEFLRLKIGISKPNDNIIDFVLSKFNQEEFKIINNIFQTTNCIINDFIDNNKIERLMSNYNRNESN